MDRAEYERRIRTLDERLEASLELVRSAHRVERRALDFLWMTSPGNAGPEGEASASLAALPLPFPPPPSPAPVRSRGRGRSRRQAEPRGPIRWRNADLTDRVLELLPQVPEVFDRDDFLREMADNPPERSMLYRVLQQLSWDGQIAVAQPGSGRYPVRYRRVAPGEAEALEE